LRRALALSCGSGWVAAAGTTRVAIGVDEATVVVSPAPPPRLLDDGPRRAAGEGTDPVVASGSGVVSGRAVHADLAGGSALSVSIDPARPPPPSPKTPATASATTNAMAKTTAGTTTRVANHDQPRRPD